MSTKLISQLNLIEIVTGLITLLAIFSIIYLIAYLLAEPGKEFKFGFIKITKKDEKKKAIILIIFVVVLTISSLILLLTVFSKPETHPNNLDNCPCHLSLDEAIARKLIESEAEAVNSKDLNLIREIFFANAKIINQNNPNQMCNDPIVHYGNVFKNEYTRAVNYYIQPENNINDSVMIFTSASSGMFNNQAYYNPPVSNRWVIKKDKDGCWKIAEFSYK